MVPRWWEELISRESPRILRGTRPASRRWPGVRLAVERLEDRLVPDSGGASGVLTAAGNMQLNPTGEDTGGFPQVIPNVKVQLIFLSDPTNHTSIPAATRTALVNHFKTITSDGYLTTLLGQYGDTLGLPAIGNGSVGVVDTGASAAPDTTVTVNGRTYPAYSDNFDTGDNRLQDVIQAEIDSGNTAPPDGLNNLYFLFTPPGDAVVNGDTSNSVHDFQGYHSAFLDSDGTDADPYAVIPDQSGVNDNESSFGLNAVQGETEVSSHELADAVADCIPLTGWADPFNNLLAEGEVADQAANETYVQDRHQVQYLWSNALSAPAHAPGSGPADLFINQVTPPAAPVGTSTAVPVATFTTANTGLTAGAFTASVFNLDSTGHGHINWPVTSIAGGNGHFVVNARPGAAVTAGTYGKLYSSQEGLYVVVHDASAADAGAVDGGAPTSDRYAPYVVAARSPLNYTAASGSGVHNFVLKENPATGNFELRDNGNLVFTQPVALTTAITIDADPAVPGKPGAGVDSSLTIDYGGGKFTNPVTFDGGPGGGTHTLTFANGTFTNETSTYTGPGGGSVTLDGQKVTFSATSALANGTGAANETFNLPRVANTVTFRENGSGATPLALLGTGTFPPTLFAGPTGSLTVASAPGTANTVTVASLPDLRSALKINGNTGGDTVNLNGTLTLGNAGGNAGSLSVAARVITVGGTIDTTAGTAGTVALTAGQSIGLRSGAGVKTAGGGITLRANTPGTAPGNFTGISVHGATIQSAGSGAISLQGQGGSSGANNVGIRVEAGGVVKAAGSGAVTLQGTGGNGTGGDAGVSLAGSGTRVVTAGGALSVTGTGQGSGANNFGVDVEAGAAVQGTGAGAISLTGTAPGNTAAITLNGLGGGPGFIAGGGGNVTLTGDVIDLFPSGGSPAVTSGSARLLLFQPNTAGRPLILGGSDRPGSLVYSDADNAAIAQGGTTGFGLIRVGRANGGGAVTTAKNVTFGTAATVQTPGNAAGGITVSNTLDAGGNTLTLLSGTTIAAGRTGMLKARALALQAGGGIGSAAAPLAMTAGTLTADSSAGNGNQFLSSTGPVGVSATRGLNAGTGTVALSGNLFLINGSTAAASRLAVNGGATLGGKGTVGGPVTVNSGGALAPGDGGPGALVTGGLTVKSGGTVRMEVGGKAAGSGYDRLNVSGTASLAGTLAVSVVNGFQPAAGNTYQVLTFASRSGDFTTRTGFNLGNGLALQEQFSPSASPTSLNLIVSPTGQTAPVVTQNPVSGVGTATTAAAAPSLQATSRPRRPSSSTPSIPAPGNRS
jgi:hypothetical protein